MHITKDQLKKELESKGIMIHGNKIKKDDIKKYCTIAEEIEGDEEDYSINFSNVVEYLSEEFKGIVELLDSLDSRLADILTSFGKGKLEDKKLTYLEFLKKEDPTNPAIPLVEQASNTFDKLYSITTELPYAVYKGKPVKE